MNAQWLRRFMNCWPPFIGAGIRVRRIADDYTETDVEMRLRWYNRNYVRTHFGGSLYSMTDPFHMILTLHQLGPDYIVWDRAGSVEYVAPGRGTVYARFRISAAEVEAIRMQAAGGGKVLPQFSIDVLDDEGKVVARVTKTLYIRRKRAAGPPPAKPAAPAVTAASDRNQ